MAGSDKCTSLHTMLQYSTIDDIQHNGTQRNDTLTILIANYGCKKFYCTGLMCVDFIFIFLQKIARKMNFSSKNPGGEQSFKTCVNNSLSYL